LRAQSIASAIYCERNLRTQSIAQYNYAIETFPLSQYLRVEISHRLIASGRIIEFGSDIRPESNRVDFKSWNRKVDSIPNVETDYSVRVANLKSKIDPKNRSKSSRLLYLVIYFIFSNNLFYF